MHFLNMSAWKFTSFWEAIAQALKREYVFLIFCKLCIRFDLAKLKSLEAHSNNWLTLKIMPLMWYELSILNQKT